MSVQDVVEPDLLGRVLGAAMRTGGEFAEVFIEDKRSTMAGLDDGRIEQVTSGRDRGAGIRVVKGDTTGFAHTADLSETGLRAAAEAASAADSQGSGGDNVVALTRQPEHRVSPVERFNDEVSKTQKGDLLRRADDAPRSSGAAIVQVSPGYGASRKLLMIANTHGLLATDE